MYTATWRTIHVYGSSVRTFTFRVKAVWSPFSDRRRDYIAVEVSDLLQIILYDYIIRIHTVEF